MPAPAGSRAGPVASSRQARWLSLLSWGCHEQADVSCAVEPTCWPLTPYSAAGACCQLGLRLHMPLHMSLRQRNHGRHAQLPGCMASQRHHAGALQAGLLSNVYAEVCTRWRPYAISATISQLRTPPKQPLRLQSVDCHQPVLACRALVGAKHAAEPALDQLHHRLHVGWPSMLRASVD